MSLQFIMGPSGSGKSHYLYQKVTEESLKHPDKNYIVLVPEQFTMQTQKELVMASPKKGIMNVDVLSFNRLAYRIFEETGENSRVVLDDVGKNFVIRKIAGDCEGELKVLGSNLKKTGYISEIKSIISEFTQYNIQAEEFERMQKSAGEYTNLYYKLGDVKRVYEGFQDYLKDKYITGEEVLDILCDAVPKSNVLKNCVVVLDEFTGFTPIQNKLLRALLRVCEQVIVTVTMSKSENPYVYTNPYQLFGLSKKMVTSLVQIAKDEKITIEEPVCLYERPLPRFKDRKALDFLESHLFRYTKKTYDEDQNEVQVWCAKSPQDEIDFVAQKIRHMIRVNAWNYRDIAIITSEQETYANQIEKVFQKYDIPFFMDHKRSILLNSFVEFLRSLIAMVEQNFTYEAVFRYLKSGFSGFTLDEIDVLENYVIAMGVRGYAKWQEKWIRKSKGMKEAELAEVNGIRKCFMDKIESLSEVLKRRSKTVFDVTRALHDFFVQEEIQKQVMEQETLFAEKGELALEKEYAQIYRIVIELFEKFVDLLGEEKITLKEYSELLDAGLEQAKVGIIPPSMDQVMVGDVERTRLKDVKVLFLVGVNDVFIPGNTRKGGIISEYDREKFAADGVTLAPTAKEKTFIQKFYLYRILTKPTEQIILSYSKSSTEGNSLRPAYLVHDILKLYPRLKIKDVARNFKEKELTIESGMSLIVEGLQQKEKGLTPEWQELYTWYKANPAWAEKIQKVVEAAYYQNPKESLTTAAAKKLYGEILENSVTRLETFSKCAYAHFLSYGLRLHEREEFQFQAVDLGNLFHGALERFSKKLEKDNYTWTTISKEQSEALVEASVEECIIDYGNTILYSSARSEYVIKRLKRMMNRTVWALKKQLENGDFAPAGYEITFGGMSQISMSNIQLDDLGQMKVYGKIDRVDTYEDDENVYVKVIDYKTGEKAFDLGELCHGIQMQLVLYMNAAMELEQKKHPDKKIVPAALLYYRMQDPIVEKVQGKELIENAILKELQPDGMVNASREVLYHIEHGTMKEYRAVPISLNNDGSISKKSNSKILTENEFAVIAKYANLQLKEAGTKILKGDIAIAPFEMGNRTGCDYCPYHVICGFDGRIEGFEHKTLEKLDKSKAIAKMREEVDSWQ